jgi:hypothetical protein
VQRASGFPCALFFAEGKEFSLQTSGASRRGNADAYLELALKLAVIPGREAKRSEPGIHNHDREYGFRARASRALE